MEHQDRLVRKLALVLEYDGTRYHGFQLQANAPTVQGQVEEAIRRFTGQKVRVKGASRTDAGAHATGQVVTVATEAPYPPETWVRALNALLPEDIKVRAAYHVPLSFDARRHATSRTYRYLILNRPTPSPLRRWTTHWVPGWLDVEAMAKAARHLMGTRDFARFTVPSYHKSTVRRLDRWDVWREEDLVVQELEANAFLPQQVRRMAAMLVEVGRGRLPESALLDFAEGRWNLPAPPILPAQGLCLVRVNYPDFPPGLGDSHDA